MKLEAETYRCDECGTTEPAGQRPWASFEGRLLCMGCIEGVFWTAAKDRGWDAQWATATT
jgi:formylmethanofuran dehydrogenase subunit E